MGRIIEIWAEGDNFVALVEWTDRPSTLELFDRLMPVGKWLKLI